MFRSLVHICPGMLTMAVLLAGCCKSGDGTMLKARRSEKISELTWEDCTSLPHGGTDPQGNGTKLLGVGFRVMIAGDPHFVGLESIDASKVRSKDGRAISSIKIHDHELTGTLPDGAQVTGDGWVGATMPGFVFCLVTPKVTFPVTLRIASVAAADAGVTLGGKSPSKQFRLEIARAGVDFMEACVTPEHGTPEGGQWKNVAYPVSGHWDDNGNYIDESDGKPFSFACHEHVVVKCLRDGYPMHDSDPSKTQMFAACTRALRADYCAHGVPFTKDGVPVTIRDTMGISSDQVPDPTERTFETAWTGDQMFCLGHLRSPIPPDAFSQSEASCALNPLRRCASEAEAARLLNGASNSLVFIYSKN